MVLSGRGGMDGDREHCAPAVPDEAQQGAQRRLVRNAAMERGDVLLLFRRHIAEAFAHQPDQPVGQTSAQFYVEGHGKRLTRSGLE